MSAPANPTIVTEQEGDRRFWTGKYPSVKIDRLRKTITVLPFSFNYRAKESLKVNPLSIYSTATTISGPAIPAYYTNMQNAFTIEAWIKPTRIITGIYQSVISFITNANARIIQFGINGLTLNVKVKKSAVDQSLDSVSYITPNEWTHVAVTYDGTTLKLYLNSVLQATTLAVAAPIDGMANLDDPAGVRVSQFTTDVDRFSGNIDELRIWNIARTATDLSNTYNKSLRGNETDLLHYFRFNDSVVDNTLVDSVSPTTFITNVTGTYLSKDDTDGFVTKTDVSWIVGRVKCTLDKKCSLKFPLTNSVEGEGEFGFFVMWVDEDNVVQRRSLWLVDGLDLYDIAAYQGEILPLTFYLEFWNVVGGYKAEITSDLIIETSLAARPLTSTDRNKQKVLTDATANDYLYETLNGNGKFPIPMVFDSQQVSNY